MFVFGCDVWLVIEFIVILTILIFVLIVFVYVNILFLFVLCVCRWIGIDIVFFNVEIKLYVVFGFNKFVIFLIFKMWVFDVFNFFVKFL